MPRFDPAPERRRAFEAEALPHLGRVLAVARRLVGNSNDAEDVTQETFLRAYRTFGNFEPGTNARAWLFTILYSVCSNRRRKVRLEPAAWEDGDLELRAGEIAVREDWETPVLEAAGTGKLGTGPVVEAALMRLTEAARSVVLLVDLEGLTYEEAAEALGCPIGTVRSRLFRARRQLAVELASYARSPARQGLSHE